MGLMHFVVGGGGSAGLGHLRRSGVLASEANRQGFSVRLFVPDPEAARAFVDARLTVSAQDGGWERMSEAAVVVADGYTITPDLGEAARKAGALMVRIDDNAETEWHPHVILNHNIHAESVDYSGWGAERLLLGIRYALVDRRLAPLASQPRPARRALVSFGGSDDGTRAAPVAAALARAGVEVCCVVAPHQKPSPELAAVLDLPGVEIAHGADMVAEAARAAVYVGSAGVTALEMAAAGLPLVLCAIAPNQVAAAAAFAARGARMVPADDPEMMADAAARLLDAGPVGRPPPLIDGLGATRVVSTLHTMLQQVHT